MRKYRGITFTAVAQKDFPGYLIQFQRSIFFYLPLEALVKLENHSISLSSLQSLNVDQLSHIGFSGYDLAHLVAFCKLLWVIPEKNKPFPIAPLVIKRQIKLVTPLLQNSSPSRQPEVRLKLHWSKVARKPTENVSYSITQTPFTQPELIVTYQNGRNYFCIGFSYLKNGLLQYHKVKLEKISQIEALDTRQLKAENLCSIMTQQLIQGWPAEKVVQAAQQHDAFY